MHTPRFHENPPSKSSPKAEAQLCLSLASLPAGLADFFLFLTFSLGLQAERGVNSVRELGKKGGEGAETTFLREEAERLTKEEIIIHCR